MTANQRRRNQGPMRNRLDEERLTELLDVATEVFIQEGFAAASTNEIARRANSSKTTFYSRFPTKEALFLAVIERRLTGIFTEVVSSLPEEAPIEMTLYDFGAALVRSTLSEDQIKLIRVVSMESGRFPELGKRYYQLGPERGRKALAAYFEKQIEIRRLSQNDPEQMAQHFLSLVTGGPVLWFVLGFTSSELSSSARKDHVDASIRVFLRAYGESSGPRKLV